jgi:hypothetical protein
MRKRRSSSAHQSQRCGSSSTASANNDTRRHAAFHAGLTPTDAKSNGPRCARRKSERCLVVRAPSVRWVARRGVAPTRTDCCIATSAFNPAGPLRMGCQEPGAWACSGRSASWARPCREWCDMRLHDERSLAPARSLEAQRGSQAQPDLPPLPSGPHPYPAHATAIVQTTAASPERASPHTASRNVPAVIARCNGQLRFHDLRHVRIRAARREPLTGLRGQ